MLAWIARRRDRGAALAEGLVIGGTSAPFSLLVQEVTDQGKRRPVKVARLYAPGTKAILAELVGVRLVWLKGDEFVLAGADVSPGERGPVHGAQSWLCKLAQPLHALGYSARFMFDHGRQLPMGQVNARWASVSHGQLRVASVLDDQLARHTTRALLRQGSGHNQLIDCELDFMGDEKFQLSGFEPQAATNEQPARLLRQGWLMAIDTQTPEQAAYIRSLQIKPQR